MGNQNPHNAPPALPVDWQHTGGPGPKYGLQSSEVWASGETDGRDICDQTRAVHMWRVSVFGTRVEVDVAFGTSLQRQFRRLRVPLVLYVPGNVTITARPTPTGTGTYIGSQVQCTCTAVSSAKQSDARLVFAGGPIPDDAARFVAFTPSVITIDGTFTVALLPTQSVALVSGAALTSGTGYLEFES